MVVGQNSAFSDDKDKEQDLRVSGEGPPVDVDDETSELAGEEDKGDRESKSMPESEVDGPGELRDNSASMGPPPPPDCEYRQTTNENKTITYTLPHYLFLPA